MVLVPYFRTMMPIYILSLPFPIDRVLFTYSGRPTAHFLVFLRPSIDRPLEILHSPLGRQEMNRSQMG